MLRIGSDTILIHVLECRPSLRCSPSNVRSAYRHNLSELKNELNDF
jgi:hypothetical protein